MSGVRSHVLGWVGRKYASRRLRHGLDLSSIGFLPQAVLMPLHRTGVDPVADLALLRHTAPIAKLPIGFGFTVWLVSGYAEAKAVLGTVQGFSNDFTHLIGTAGATAADHPGGLGFADPPEHTRLRHLLTPEFTRRRLQRLIPRIESIVANQLDNLGNTATGTVDLWQDFALPIPAMVICELLGIPSEDRADFQRLGTARFDLLAGAHPSLGALSESLTYLRGVMKHQRSHPGDGLLGMLITEHGNDITDEELAGLADGLLTGGLETTASMLALGALSLLQDDQARERLLSDATAAAPVVEELLRYLSVVQVAFPRFATQDMQTCGVQIGAGDLVMCSLSGANRDQTLGPGMEHFDPARDPTAYLAFGYGIHRCLAAELARMELRIAYPALLRRYPDIALAVAPEELSFRTSSLVFGLDALPQPGYHFSPTADQCALVAAPGARAVSWLGTCRSFDPGRAGSPRPR